MELQVRGKGYGCSNIHHLGCTIGMAMDEDCLKYRVPAAALIEGKFLFVVTMPIHVSTYIDPE